MICQSFFLLGLRWLDFSLGLVPDPAAGADEDDVELVDDEEVAGDVSVIFFSY
ncbi:hypothetical protein IH781_01790 [Patescibacteria group bacterium]|nr:hypothetical protein [Patescibacteria group bacterium]